MEVLLDTAAILPMDIQSDATLDRDQQSALELKECLIPIF
jgi:hypothetical protein